MYNLKHMFGTVNAVLRVQFTFNSCMESSVNIIGLLIHNL